MDNSAIAIVVSLIVAVVGGFGGLAALLKVNSDNSTAVASGARTVSDAAAGVVVLINERMDEQEGRVDALEDYVVHFDAWADRLLRILERAIVAMPEAMRAEFDAELAALKASRPPRAAAVKKQYPKR